MFAFSRTISTVMGDRFRARGRMAANGYEESKLATVARPRYRDGHWQIHPILFEEPTLHRLRFGDVKGTGRKQLVVTALQGHGNKRAELGGRAGGSRARS